MEAEEINPVSMSIVSDGDDFIRNFTSGSAHIIEVEVGGSKFLVGRVAAADGPRILELQWREPDDKGNRQINLDDSYRKMICALVSKSVRKPDGTALWSFGNVSFMYDDPRFTDVVLTLYRAAAEHNPHCDPKNENALRI